MRTFAAAPSTPVIDVPKCSRSASSVVIVLTPPENENDVIDGYYVYYCSGEEKQGNQVSCAPLSFPLVSGTTRLIGGSFFFWNQHFWLLNVWLAIIHHWVFTSSVQNLCISWLFSSDQNGLQEFSGGTEMRTARKQFERSLPDPQQPGV